MASSSKSMSNQNPAADTAASAGPVNASSRQQPKKKGFLSFLNCCSVPDNANGAESDEAVPMKRVTKISSTTAPNTASQPPVAERSNQAITEKDANQHEMPATSANDNRTSDVDVGAASVAGIVRQTSTREKFDQPLPPLPKDPENHAQESIITQSPAPVVVVDEPRHIEREENAPAVPDPPEIEDDTVMVDAPVEDKEVKYPPPPPLPGTDNKAVIVPVTNDSSDEKQQWLLPPIAPRFKGKKCLVLDLDETLVHSSFKVREQEEVFLRTGLIVIDFASGRLHNSSRNRRPVSQRLCDKTTRGRSIHEEGG